MPLKGVKVLLVEDDPIVREIAAAELLRAGLLVVEATTGEEALAILEQGDMPDVLFTDIRLPGSVDGWEVAEQFRARDPELPVIYATAYSKSQTPVEGSLFFRKPYRVQQLLLAIGALTGSRRA